MLLLTNNNKKSIQKLRQVFASIILSASCIIPVVAGNEKTHVDKPKKSTSSWLRTGLELLLGAGCVGGVVREFQNNNKIKSREAEITQLKQDLENKSAAELTTEQRTKLNNLKTLIETVYNAENPMFSLKASLELAYCEDVLSELNKTMQINASHVEQEGLVATYMKAIGKGLLENPLSKTEKDSFTIALSILYLLEHKAKTESQLERGTGYAVDNQKYHHQREMQTKEKLKQTKIDQSSEKHQKFEEFYAGLLASCSVNTIPQTTTTQNLTASAKKTVQKTKSIAEYILANYRESQKSEQQSLFQQKTYNLTNIDDPVLLIQNKDPNPITITAQLTLNKDKSLKSLKPKSLAEVCQIFLSEYYLNNLLICTSKKAEGAQQFKQGLNNIKAAYLVLNLLTNSSSENPRTLEAYYTKKNENLTKVIQSISTSANNTLKSLQAFPYYNVRTTFVD